MSKQQILHYKVEHNDRMDFSRAPPFECEVPGFTVRLADAQASVTLKGRYETTEDARAFIEPFLRAWELDIGLRYGPGALTFAFSQSENFSFAGAATFSMTGGSATMILSPPSWPAPPEKLSCDEITDLMYARYALYRRQGTLLGDAANFCLTCMERGGAEGRPEIRDARDAACEYYSVSRKVLSKLGALADNKGGTHARKAYGAKHDFHPREGQWLEAAMLLLIRRAAEVAYDSTLDRPLITLADLPPLPEQR